MWNVFFIWKKKISVIFYSQIPLDDSLTPLSLTKKLGNAVGCLNYKLSVHGCSFNSIHITAKKKTKQKLFKYIHKYVCRLAGSLLLTVEVHHDVAQFWYNHRICFSFFCLVKGSDSDSKLCSTSKLLSSIFV